MFSESLIGIEQSEKIGQLKLQLFSLQKKMDIHLVTNCNLR